MKIRILPIFLKWRSLKKKKKFSKTSGLKAVDQ